MSSIVAQHEQQVRLAWTMRMVLRLREGSATTGELIEASGAKGWRQRAIVRPLVRKVPGIRCLGMEPGTRGLKTYRWEL